MTTQEKIIEILKSCENRIDDSDYHEKAIFPCDYNYIAKEIATLESHQPEETILVDDPSLPNIGRRISKKEYESQFSKEQPKKTAEEWLKENGYTNIMTMTPDNLAIILKRYASQGQPEVSDLRKELIKFFKWFIPESIGNRMAYEQYIDEYIKKVKQLTGK